AASGSFLSQVFDAGVQTGGQQVAWTTLTATTNTPSGTTLAYNVRMGNTATPDSTWTNFVPLSGSGATIGGKSRYLQYRIDMATTVPGLTPVVCDLSLGYTSVDTFPATIVSRSPAPGTTGIVPSSGITVSFSELMKASTLTSSTFSL